MILLTKQNFFIAALAVIALVVLITYQPALRLNFYGDDYSFVEKAGRSSFSDYLSFYLDPRAQTGWYRPMQGMVFGVEFLLFDGNPFGYHLVNVIVHLFNCLLAFLIVRQVLSNVRIAFLAALIYSALPLYSVAVFWPGDADFQLILFYLLAIFFWIRFLQERKQSFQIIAFISFLLALATKEFGVTLPLTLFVIERFVLRDNTNPGALVRRYAPFALVFAVYLPMEYFIQSRSVLTNQFGYGVGMHGLSNFLGYLAALAFPWGLPEPVNWLWLALVALLLVYLSVRRKNLVPLALVSLSVLAFLPVILFPWFLLRYLYGAVLVTAIFIAAVVERVSQRFSTRWFALAAGSAIALIVLGNSWATANAAADFAELGRQSRVPFRDVTQRHATFPEDAYLYFINPPSPTSEYSGMFFIRYGPRISVSSNHYQGRRANLRDHNAAYVIYFDEEQRTREIVVDKNLVAQSDAKPPIKFDSFVLEGYELANDRAKRGEAIALILYWRTTQTMEAPNISIQLVESATRRSIVSVNESTRIGKTIGESWQANALVIDARILPIPSNAPIGKYSVDISVGDSPNKFMIEPLSVVE